MAFGIRLKRTLADDWFSRVIRTRAKWACEYCFLPCIDKKGYLDCSHYHSRAKKSVRFDEDNAAAFCKRCHDYLGKDKEPNKSDHRHFFIRRLGQTRFDLLELRARTPQPVDESLIVLWCKEEVKRLEAKEMVFGRH